MYTSTVNGITKMITCTPLLENSQEHPEELQDPSYADVPTRILNEDDWINCDTTTYLSWQLAAWLTVGLWGLGFPLAAFVLLTVFRKK